MDQDQRISPGDFYTDTVLPALAERLDHAFPEFGWRRDNRGWVATNQETTRRLLGVRADRIVAHGYAPQGFLVHGGQPVLWTAYLNGGSVPRGSEFVRTVRDLAHRAGIDPTPLERPVPRDRRTDLLDDFFALSRQELAARNGSDGRTYLERRGLPPDSIERSGLGIVPQPTQVRHALHEAGYTESEIAESNLLADSRWPGRLCGAWRDQSGRVRTFWARSIDDDASPNSRYLYLRGASRTNLPPYGLSDALAGSSETRHELVLVEGVFDVHQLRSRGINNVAAVGGTAVRTEIFERLVRVGVHRVTLCFDNDQAGRAATERAVEQAARAKESPSIHVVDPKDFGAAKDPDEIVSKRGAKAWHEILEQRKCGITWRAAQLLGDVTFESPPETRRRALDNVGSWLGTLPPRLALEQEDAVRTVSERAGYSAEAATRSFRARFWVEPGRNRQPGMATPISR